LRLPHFPAHPLIFVIPTGAHSVVEGPAFILLPTTLMKYDHHYYVYLVASRTRVLYCGVTNNIGRRVAEHRERSISGFSAKYLCERLVWYEQYQYINNAIDREKQNQALEPRQETLAHRTDESNLDRSKRKLEAARYNSLKLQSREPLILVIPTGARSASGGTCFYLRATPSPERCTLTRNLRFFVIL